MYDWSVKARVGNIFALVTKLQLGNAKLEASLQLI